ncbi:carboxypeptidase-like regulatory domain-containing protein [Ferrimicrobium sp.]|uniref:alpha-amylase n=1 Tax=Ferrimicrobium acidiphilum TaxID=121039 RepID=A0ABV3Y0T3_9ACTN|nr:carboxypeptidase-like regulatory domain-containing protein [Ferrimicrobium sp.]
MAFTILAAVVGPATYLVERSTQLSASSREQVVASNLAQSEIQVLDAEATRSFTNLTNMLGTSTHTATIGSIVYTITDNLYWTEGTSNPNGCNANATSSQVLEPILSASVTVTWTGMAPFPPVRSTTGYHVPAGYSSPTTGSVLVVAQNQAGVPDSNVIVSLVAQGAASDTAQTVQTDSQGCALFPFITPGVYAVSLSAPSGQTWITPASTPDPSQTVTVSASQSTQADFTYAQAASFSITYPNIPIPWAFGVSLGSTSLPGGETIYSPNPSSSPVTGIAPVFPATTGYQAWLGQCQLYTSFSGTGLGQIAIAQPGTTSAINLLGQPVTITVTKASSPVSGATVSVQQTDANGTPLSGCSNSITAVGTTNSNGQLTFLAPIGYVTITVTDGSSSTPYPSTGALQTPGGGSIDVPIALG